MSARVRPLDLGELIDLEIQFVADRDVDRQTLRERDDRIGRHIASGVTQTSRHELFRQWLGQLRGDASSSVGERVEALYRWIGLALAGAAFLTGAGTARAVLAYDGTDPVNVIHFLAVFVAAQMGLLVLWAAAMVPAVRSAGHRAYAPIHELLRHLVYHRFAGGRGGRAGPLLGRLEALGTIYGAAERWRLMALTQRAAFLFNLGALCACLYLITFTDLAFAWSTTLEIRSETMTALLHALAWPWRWLEAAVPSAALVEASRYFRLAGRYDPHALKDWWAFLLAALATYGLLPRFVLWQFSAWRSRSVRRRLPLDHGDCQVVYERLTRCLHGWCTESPASHAPAEVALDTPAPAPLAPRSDGLPCTVVRWADVPLGDDEAAHLIARRFGWRIDALHECGGRESTGETAGVLAAVAREPRERPLLLLAEAWEAPSRAVTRFLREVRRTSAERRNVVIGLLGACNGAWSAPDPEDYEVWRRSTAELADPYLRVEPLIGDGA